MSKLTDFHEGERVAHIRIGDGVVSLVEFDCIHVAYDNGATGIYDQKWFTAHPKYLFHRSDPNEATA